MYWKCSYGYEKDNISQIKISYLVFFFQLFATVDHLPSSYPIPSIIMLSHQPCACPNSGNNLKQYTVVCLKRRQTVIVFQAFWWPVKVLQSSPVPHHFQIQITVNVKKEVTKQSQKERDRCSIGLELLFSRWCWQFWQNWWNYECNTVSTVRSRSTIQYHLENIWLATT